LRPRSFCQRGAQPAQQLVARCRHGVAARADGERPRIQTHFQPVAKANEGIAREPFTPLDAFQQEARLESGQLGKRRYRRIQVSGDVKWRLQVPILPTRNSGNKKPIPGGRRWVLV
jgi:hypothetical protein